MITRCSSQKTRATLRPAPFFTMLAEPALLSNTNKQKSEISGTTRVQFDVMFKTSPHKTPWQRGHMDHRTRASPIVAKTKFGSRCRSDGKFGWEVVQNFVFFPLQPQFFFLSSLFWGVFSWNDGGVLKRGALRCALLEFSGCRVKPLLHPLFPSFPLSSARQPIERRNTKSHLFFKEMTCTKMTRPKKATHKSLQKTETTTPRWTKSKKQQ